MILGAGFAGLTAAQHLAGAELEVTVIDRHNYHLFQPLLYQVATAGLSPPRSPPRSAASCAGQENATVRLARVTGIDRANRQVETDEGRIGYDWLVVATGARHAYFGHDEWEPYAPGLKRIDDATALRRHILMAFEKAENAAADMMRQRQLTFVVVGGGPTGVELAGAIAELAKTALAQDFRNIDPREARIVLIEAGERLLAAFPAVLSAHAKRALEKLGVEVRLGRPGDRLQRQGRRHRRARGYRIRMRDLGGRRGRLAGGQMAGGREGSRRPGQGQSGSHLAGPSRDLRHRRHRPRHGRRWQAGARRGAGRQAAGRLRRRHAAPPDPGRRGGCRGAPRFRYRNFGTLATIGRASAVADFGWIRVNGYLAWLLWGMIHVFFLVGSRNRLAVLTEWLWAYVSFRRGARLITGSDS